MDLLCQTTPLYNFPQRRVNSHYPSTTPTTCNTLICSIRHLPFMHSSKSATVQHCTTWKQHSQSCNPVTDRCQFMVIFVFIPTQLMQPCLNRIHIYWTTEIKAKYLLTCYTGLQVKIQKQCGPLLISHLMYVHK